VAFGPNFRQRLSGIDLLTRLEGGISVQEEAPKWNGLSPREPGDKQSNEREARNALHRDRQRSPLAGLLGTMGADVATTPPAGPARACSRQIALSENLRKRLPHEQIARRRARKGSGTLYPPISRDRTALRRQRASAGLPSRRLSDMRIGSRRASSTRA
jgi:hypothetical protein